MYLDGQSIFAAEEGSLSFIEDEQSLYERAKNAASLFEEVKDSLPFLYESGRNRSAEELELFLAAKGLGEENEGNWQLKNPEDVWQSLNFNSASDAALWLAELSAGLDELQNRSPFSRVVQETLFGWQRALENFMLNKALQWDDSFTENGLDQMEERYEDKWDVLQQVSSESDPLRGLAAALLFESGDVEIQPLLKEALACEMAARLSDMEANLDLEETWQPVFESILDNLEILESDPLADSLNSVRQEAQIQAAALVRETLGTASEASDTLIINARLSGLPLSVFAGSLQGNFEEFSRHIAALKVLDDSLSQLDANALWNAQNVRAALEDWLDDSVLGNYLEGLVNKAQSLDDQFSHSLTYQTLCEQYIPEWISEGWDAVFSQLESGYPGDSLYQGALAAGVMETLEELNLANPLEYVQWLLTRKNFSPSLSLEAYQNGDAQQKEILLWGQNAYSSLWYLKNAALGGELTGELENAFTLPDEDAENLHEFTALLEASARWIGAVDGSFNNYLETLELVDSSTPLKTRSVWIQAQKGIWDDAFFTPALEVIGEGTARRIWAARVLAHRNNLFGNIAGTALSLWHSKAAEDLQAEGTALALKVYKASFQDRMEDMRAHSAGGYRLYAGKEYFKLEEDEYWSDDEENIDADRLEDMKAIVPAGYGASGAEEAALAEWTFRQNRRQAEFEDAWAAWKNSSLDSTALAVFHNALNNEGSINPGWNVSLDAKRNAAFNTWYSRENERENLQQRMEEYGASIADYYANEIDGDYQSGILEAREAIENIKTRMQQAEEKWQNLIGSPVSAPPDPNAENLTYREAEALYSASFARVKEALQTLDEAKYRYKTAKAIRDYASSAYLGENGEEEQEWESTLQAELDELKKNIDGVDPLERYQDIADHYRRSQDIVNTLEDVYAEADAAPDMLERDAEWRGLREAFGHARRREIALQELEALLETFTGNIQAEYERIPEKMKAQFETFSFSFSEEPDEFLKIFEGNVPSQAVLLKGMDVHWDAEGKAIISYDGQGVLSEDPERMERLKQFFGLSELTEGREGYEELFFFWTWSRCHPKIFRAGFTVSVMKPWHTGSLVAASAIMASMII